MQRKHSMLLSSTSVDGWTLASTVCLCSLVKKVAMLVTMLRVLVRSR